MNVQHSLIWELILYEFKLGHNTTEVTKNTYCMKGEGPVDYNSSNQMVSKILLRLQEPQQSGKFRVRLKTLDSVAVVLALEINPVSSTWSVSGELSISQPSLVNHLHNLSKSIQSYQIVLQVTKILQNFWLILLFYWITQEFFKTEIHF